MMIHAYKEKYESLGMNYIVITKASPKFNALLEKLRFSSKNYVNG